MSGSCLGTFVLAPLSSILSENYGWRAAVGLYAGILNSDFTYWIYNVLVIYKV